MLRKIIVFIASVGCNAADNGSFYYSAASDHCTAQYYSSRNLPCDPQSFQYKHDLDTLFGNGTSLNYDLKKKSDNEMVSIAANFKRSNFSGQLQASYQKEIGDNQSLNGSAQVYLHYRIKSFNDLKIGASERFVYPILDNHDEPNYFISSLHSDYTLNDSYNLFMQSTYASFKNSNDSYIASSLHNPYTVTTGFSYNNGNDTQFKTSFSQDVQRDKTLDAQNNLNVVLKKKINRHIQSKLLFSKNISSAQLDDKTFINFNYAF